MRKIILITICLILFGCASVTVNKNPSVEFSKYKKIAIVDVSNNIGSFAFGKALEGELMSKGIHIVIVERNDSHSNADAVIEVAYVLTFIARIIETDSNALVATIQSSGPSDSFTSPDVVSRLMAKRIGELFSQKSQ